MLFNFKSGEILTRAHEGSAVTLRGHFGEWNSVYRSLTGFFNCAAGLSTSSRAATLRRKRQPSCPANDVSCTCRFALSDTARSLPGNLDGTCSVQGEDVAARSRCRKTRRDDTKEKN